MPTLDTIGLRIGIATARTSIPSKVSLLLFCMLLSAAPCRPKAVRAIFKARGNPSSGRLVNGYCRTFETSVVPENQNDHARHDHEGGEAVEASGEGARQILHPTDEERTDEAAEIAERVDQGDPAGGRGAAQHRRRERPKTWQGGVDAAARDREVNEGGDRRDDAGARRQRDPAQH